MRCRRAPAPPSSSPRRAATCGQATVELVFVLPVVVALALVVVQVAVVARRSILVAHAAREGVRAAAVEPDPAAARTAARDAALAASGLDPAHVQIDVSVDARDVVVVVRYDDPTDVAVLGRLVGPVRLQERATMRREPP